MKIKEKPAPKVAGESIRTRNKQGDALPLVRHAVNGIEEKKGSEIACLNLKKISNSPCDYFVICEGTSRTHVQAIAGSVEELIKKETGSRPWHVEGLQNAEWVLMDYVDVVVHIFQPHVREHFGLEEMWADAEIKDLTTKIAVKKVPAPAVKKKKTAPKKIKKTAAKKAGKKVTAVKKTIKKKAKSKK